ncbi:hypothetical protein CNR34_00028 [Pseudomonas phage nickie]|uniref:Minor tail protein n=1 Tax=Pseudomonas phage nickie TaxID=2048977 RepID=A0A2H4P710_9CAUD|nr:minor tail protein [Pseudomonas phage nickie]ATW57961.1 hypothetical protein CNR34_00028 [Pseudomonas phage nickie]
MPKNLSLSTVAETNSFSSEKVWLIALQIHVVNHQTGAEVERIRVVNNSEIVTIEGEPYEPMGFDIDINEKTNQLPSVQVTLQDQGELVGPYMHRYGGGVGFEVDLLIVAADVGDPVVHDYEPELAEFFTITKGSYKDYVATWTMGAENPLRKMFPLRKQEPDQCSFRYKDARTCGYGGGLASCDLSFDGPNGCRAHNNTKNYGGYPGIIVRS